MWFSSGDGGAAGRATGWGGCLVSGVVVRTAVGADAVSAAGLGDGGVLGLGSRLVLVLLGQVRLDQQLEQAAADEAADERADDGHPEVEVAVLVAHGLAVAGDQGGQPGAEVAGGVDRVAGVHSPGHAEADHDQAHHDRSEVGQWRVVGGGGQREDHEDQDRRADDLVEEGVGDADLVGAVAGQRGEDALGGDRVAGVDRGDEVGVGEADDDRGHEGAGELGGHVGADLAPLEPLERGQRQRDRGVEVRPAEPGRGVDAERDADAPHPADRVVLAGR